MKKIKFAILVLLGLSLLGGFMTPGTSQTPPYANIMENETYEWDFNLYMTTWGQWSTDNMTAWMVDIFGHSAGENYSTYWTHWAWDATPPQSIWSLEINTILAENTSSIFNSSWGIPDSVTYVPYSITWGYSMPDYPTGNLFGPETRYLLNDSAGFAISTGYGAALTTPYWVMGNVISPKNMNMTELAALLDAGFDFHPSPLAGNATVTEITDGVSIMAPVMGWGNNTLPVYINATWDADGVMQSITWQYGSNILMDMIFSGYTYQDGPPVITAASADFSVEVGYTGVTINWTVTDISPNSYKIFKDGTQVGSTAFWSSGVAIHFNVPNGYGVGVYNITIQLNDGELVTEDTVIMTVTAAPAPPAIPGYDVFAIIGIFSLTTISIIAVMKRKNK